MLKDLETFPAGSVQTPRRRDVLSFARQRRTVVWTPQQDEVLRRELEAGKSASEAAAAINEQFATRYSRMACIGRAYRIGLRSLVPPQEPKPRNRKDRPAAMSPSIAPTPAPAECTVDPVPLLQLKHHHCRAPLDLWGADGLMLFCGTPALPGYSYCAGHCARFFQSQPRRLLQTNGLNQ